jgi:hypothetical protein
MSDDDDDFDGLLDDEDDEFLRMVDTLEHSAAPVGAQGYATHTNVASPKYNGAGVNPPGATAPAASGAAALPRDHGRRPANVAASPVPAPAVTSRPSPRVAAGNDSHRRMGAFEHTSPAAKR